MTIKTASVFLAVFNIIFLTIWMFCPKDYATDTLAALTLFFMVAVDIFTLSARTK